MNIISNLAVNIVACLTSMVGISLTPESVPTQNNAEQTDFSLALDADLIGQFEQARILYAKVCDNGVAKGCYNLGILLAKGRGGAIDAAQARILYARACDGGIIESCSSLGVLFASGQGGAADAVQASRLFTKACDSGHASGCYNLSILVDQSKGVTVKR